MIKNYGTKKTPVTDNVFCVHFEKLNTFGYKTGYSLMSYVVVF